jgi:hypothetical protein
MMFGDTEKTLTPACHEIMEAEANYAAGRLLFLGNRFIEEARSVEPTLASVKDLSRRYDNTMTSALWRFVEQAQKDRPVVVLVIGHPHPARRKADFDPSDPCRYCIQSPMFRLRFVALTQRCIFERVVGYCGAQQGGPLGEDGLVLTNINGAPHLFHSRPSSTATRHSLWASICDEPEWRLRTSAARRGLRSSLAPSPAARGSACGEGMNVRFSPEVDLSAAREGNVVGSRHVVRAAQA